MPHARPDPNILLSAARADKQKSSNEMRRGMTTDRTPDNLAARYERIAAQLDELFVKTEDPTARMATAAALLHHKMPHFFWTGFYILRGDELIVGPYQGPLACAVLSGREGVCWAGIARGESILVPNVEAFPGHVACDSRSKSEIVVPLYNTRGEVAGVCDVDSDRLNAFTDVDVLGVERIVRLIRLPVD